MKKLSINIPEGLGDVLSQEELKHVLGGMGSQGSLGSEPNSSKHACGCTRDNIGAKCTCETYTGTCQLWYGTGFCSGLNRVPSRA